MLVQVKESKQAEKDADEKAQQGSSSLPKDASLRNEPFKDPSLKDSSLKDPSLHSNHSPPSTWRQAQEDIKPNGQGSVSSYLKFKELHYEQQKSPYDSDLKKELRNLSKDIFKNKEMFGQIEGLDPEISNLIKEKALEKTRELDRGGFSL